MSRMVHRVTLGEFILKLNLQCPVKLSTICLRSKNELTVPPAGYRYLLTKIKIDGYDAYVLEIQIDTKGAFADIYTSVMFGRTIFFIAYDQVYTIDFLVAERERGGEFEKGYDYFFNSLKIVP